MSFGENFRIYNLSIEKLYSKLKNYEFNKENEDKEFDICILDCFPETNTSPIQKIAEKIAIDVLIV
jgi:hypothetical protein